MLVSLSIPSLQNMTLFFASAATTILITVGVFFGVLLLLGVRKSYKLKKENERLEAMNKKMDEEEEKPYRDFTEGHMYGGDN
ncbi:hypothetical protein [Flavisericum labens]|uniref:hypothetical protein n=1 Tax=Flavisericum labens TaxID=3377112 RepID=UPI00387AA9C6